MRRIPPHRILAINRGEKEGPLKGRLELDVDAVRRVAFDKLPLAGQTLESIERNAIAQTLEQCGGNKSRQHSRCFHFRLLVIVIR